jgi:hypothetical protein
MGNKKTKAITILRELPFKKDDILAEDKLIKEIEVAREHLTNTSLFNFVDIDYIPDTIDNPACLSCILLINVTERWYIWPQVSLKLEDRNLSSWLKEKEYNRITIGWGLRIYNVFGMNHKVSASNYFGFEKGGRLSYTNIALDKERTKMLGFSIVNLYNKTLNMYSEDNKVVYVKNPDNFLDRTLEANVHYTYRPILRSTHTFNLGFSNRLLNNSVLITNKDYWGSDRLNNNTLMASYQYGYEHRDYIVYPTKGYFIGVETYGAAADKMNFFYGQIKLKLQYYKEFYPRLFWGSRLNTSVSFKNKKAYIYDQNVGYEDNVITGYDYFVVDGQHFTILNNDLRFSLLPRKVIDLQPLKFLSSFKKIHLSLYARLSYDIGYVYNNDRRPSNTMANSFLWGSSFGIDLLTYYDIVLNCSYGINKSGDKGWYFGIKAPIF